jgi:peptide deformylase
MNADNPKTLDIDILENLSKFDILKSDLKIHQYPDPVLRKKSEPVIDFNEETNKICLELSAFCWHIMAMGLSAPQVGISKRILVINKQIAMNIKRPSIFINPIIVNATGESVYKEGCVSLPEIFGNVKRFNSFDVEYQDVDGNKHVEHVENTSNDIFGTIIQHECEHLDGGLFIDKLSSFDKDKVIGKINKLRKLTKKPVKNGRVYNG